VGWGDGEGVKGRFLFGVKGEKKTLKKRERGYEALNARFALVRDNSWGKGKKKKGMRSGRGKGEY